MSYEGDATEVGEDSKAVQSFRVGGSSVGGVGAGKSTRQAIVVLGEASESDDDEILTDHSSGIRVSGKEDNYETTTNKTGLTQGASNVTGESTNARPQQQKKSRQAGTANDSLLHRKLREKNAALREHIVQGCKQPYRSAARDLVAMTQLLVKSQSSVQESSTIFRQVTNNLFNMEDKLDITIDCSRLVPDIDIRIPAKTPVDCN